MKQLRSVCLVMCTVLLMPASVFGQQPTDTLSKQLLMKLSRGQSQTLCESEVFTQCMGFDRQQCLMLSEKALKQCFGPLPDTIILSELRNETLEACPQSVYTEAGYEEEKAQACLQEALK